LTFLVSDGGEDGEASSDSEVVLYQLLLRKYNGRYLILPVPVYNNQMKGIPGYYPLMFL